MLAPTVDWPSTPSFAWHANFGAHRILAAWTPKWVAYTPLIYRESLEWMAPLSLMSSGTPASNLHPAYPTGLARHVDAHSASVVQHSHECLCSWIKGRFDESPSRWTRRRDDAAQHRRAPVRRMARDSMPNPTIEPTPPTGTAPTRRRAQAGSERYSGSIPAVLSTLAMAGRSIFASSWIRSGVLCAVATPRLM